MLDNMYNKLYIIYVNFRLYMKLENNIKKLRFEKNDMSQDILAKEVGVSRQTIISIEKSRYIPSTILALKIAKYFNKPVEEVFYLVDEEK